MCLPFLFGLGSFFYGWGWASINKKLRQKTRFGQRRKSSKNKEESAPKTCLVAQRVFHASFWTNNYWEPVAQENSEFLFHKDFLQLWYKEFLISPNHNLKFLVISLSSFFTDELNLWLRVTQVVTLKHILTNKQDVQFFSPCWETLEKIKIINESKPFLFFFQSMCPSSTENANIQKQKLSSFLCIHRQLKMQMEKRLLAFL